jgi:transposase
MIGRRTRLISQMRGFCLEYGIAIHQGAGNFKAEIPRVLANESNELTSSIRGILTEIHGEMMELEHRIAAMSHEIEAIAARSGYCTATDDRFGHWSHGLDRSVGASRFRTSVPKGS